MSAVITLLTDFGYRDGYVGVMKGVIAGICPTARLIDLTHDIPAQNLAAARFTLLNAYAYFPEGTVHLAVIDPGVGTGRRAIAVQSSQGYFVGPDNGVLSGALDTASDLKAVELTATKFWRSPQPSSTFHGRDIFAPVAAHLANGTDLSDLGPPIALDSLLRIAIPQPQITETKIVGCAQHIDHFGNIITTIPAAAVGRSAWKMCVGAVEMPLGKTYGEVAVGHAIAVVGSHGWVEIAVNGSSAYARLRLAIGDEIQLVAI
ncbi:MAG: S-adenosyl-l-methionine hydroxide adenosyltransferase family protein [Leptolyngbyaceae cyanobacterium]